MADAKTAWTAKNARQSTTLAQACTEYKRRNAGRNPPKGFDKWWDYVRCVPISDALVQGCVRAGRSLMVDI